MAKIYELTEQQNEILHRLFWLDENNEENAEEIARLKNDLLKIRGDATNTLNFLSAMLLESRAILSGREEAKRRAESRRKTAERAVERLTNVITHIMSSFDIKKVALDNADLRLQLSPGALVYAPDFDPATLPKDCYKLEFKPLAAEIKAYLEDGAEIEGVSLVQRETLRVG